MRKLVSGHLPIKIVRQLYDMHYDVRTGLRTALLNADMVATAACTHVEKPFSQIRTAAR